MGRTLLVCVVVLGVVDVAATIITGRQVDAAIAKLRAEGAPVTTAEAAPPPIPADQNAAPLYLEVARIIGPHAPALPGKAAASPAGAGARATEPVEYGDTDWDNPEHLKILAGYLRQDAPALELLEEAAQRPGCRFDLDWPNGPLMADCPAKLRDITRLCISAMMVAAAQGDGALVGKRLKEAIAVVRHSSQQPSVVFQLTAAAMVSMDLAAAEHAVPRASIPEAEARAIAALITGADLTGAMARALEALRADGLDGYRQARATPAALAWTRGAADPEWQRALDELVHRDRTRAAAWSYVRLLPAAVNLDELAFLRLSERMIGAASLPWGETKKVAAEIDQLRAGALRWTVILPCVSLSSTVLEKRPRSHALLNLLCGALGLAVYKQRNGEYPEALEELARVNWPVPQDPFAGRPMRYRREGERYVLYSIGEDGVDDGGKPVWMWAIHRTGPKPSEEDFDKGDLPWQWR